MDIRPFKLGIIGCGDIARKAYVPACRRFPFLAIEAVADLDVARARAFATELGIPRGGSVEELLADPAIEIVLNLTVPRAHAPVDLQILRAGKHVWSEKPFAVTRAEGQAVVDLARARGLTVGCAPDTVLGCGIQTCRRYLDEGLLGAIVGGSVNLLWSGHESWHPSPEFYYEPGGGPLFDMGPYYLHALLTLLGPVRSVSGMTAVTFPTRTITSAPKRGKVIPVEVPTHLTGLLHFASGAIVTLTMSFDIRAGATLTPFELWGTEGTLQVPDPNGTGGPIRLSRRGRHGLVEYERTHPYREGSRGVGVADQAVAIRTGRPFRANADLALHALDIMVAIHESAAEGRTIALTTTCERPAPMRADLPEWTLEP